MMTRDEFEQAVKIFREIEQIEQELVRMDSKPKAIDFLAQLKVNGARKGLLDARKTRADTLRHEYGVSIETSARV